MKYIRTKDGVYEIERYYEPRDYYWIKQDCDQPIVGDEIISKADTIEELCDEFVHKNYAFKSLQELYDYWEDMYSYDKPTYGAIWTDKGLIYVAKMNENGELELL